MAAALLAAAGSSTLIAATKTYKYKCPRCHLVLEYARQSIYKCPQDGTTMNALK
jgi:peptide subunit release factor 1 (eRF1)